MLYSGFARMSPKKEAVDCEVFRDKSTETKFDSAEQLILSDIQTLFPSCLSRNQKKQSKYATLNHEKITSHTSTEKSVFSKHSRHQFDESSNACFSDLTPNNLKNEPKRRFLRSEHML